MEVAAGAFHLKRRLSLAEQRVLVDACRALVDGEVPAYVPVVRGGGRMHVRYEAEGRMGLHQDKDESPQSLAAGVPVVSISLGDAARFLFGGVRRRDPVDTLLLESGDAFVFGGAARLRYHGVSRILPATAPPELGLTGRYNLTFRQYDLQ